MFNLAINFGNHLSNGRSGELTVKYFDFSRFWECDFGKALY